VLTTSRRSVVRVDAAVERYECEQFGDIGPLRIHARARARIDGRGRFALTSGTRAERVSVTGTVTSRGATGTLRVRGTIATGQRCASPALRFSARPR
jgi:hypothetical protein